MKKNILITENQCNILLEYAGYADMWEIFISYAVPIIQKKFNQGEMKIIFNNDFLRKCGLLKSINNIIINIFIDEPKKGKDDDKDDDKIKLGGFSPGLIHISPYNKEDYNRYYGHININEIIINSTHDLRVTLLHELTHFYETIFRTKNNKKDNYNKQEIKTKNSDYNNLFKFIAYNLSPSELNAHISEIYFDFNKYYDDLMQQALEDNNGTRKQRFISTLRHSLLNKTIFSPIINALHQYLTDNPQNVQQNNKNFKESFTSASIEDFLKGSSIGRFIKDLKQYIDDVKDNDSYMRGLFDICQKREEARNFFEGIYSNNIDVFKSRLYKYLDRKAKYIDKKVTKMHERFIQNKLEGKSFNNRNTKDPLYDDISQFNNLTRVELNGRYNIINKKTNSLTSNVWYDSIIGDDKNNDYGNFFRVRAKDKYNLINKYDGSSLKYWFDMILSFNGDFAIVNLNNKCNYIDRNGNILYEPNNPNKWFDSASYFYDGFADVNLNGVYYKIDTNGKLYNIE